MRNSIIPKWAKNNKLASGKKEKWIHAPETLLQGHVVYLVKFLGSTEVTKPKGIEVVKQGIQKLKFDKELKKSETGKNKSAKVELTISAEGVVVQEPKTKKVLHQYPLYKISYCADDKAEKRFFSFIAKDGGENVQHICYVFVSDKLAEEITLTIGQAFELAYKKYTETSGKELEKKKSALVMQKRIELLEKENAELKRRLKDVASIKGQRDVQEYMQKNDITEICEVSGPLNSSAASTSNEASPSNTLASNTQPPKDEMEGKDKKTDELICLEATATKLDGFSLDDLNDDDFNPRAFGANTSAAPEEDSDDTNDENDFNPRADLPPPATKAPAVILAPPPALPPREAPPIPTPSNNTKIDVFSSDDPFASNPFTGSQDPFGMSAFDSGAKSKNPLDAFQAGLGIGNFSLDELDPLKK